MKRIMLTLIIGLAILLSSSGLWAQAGSNCLEFDGTNDYVNIPGVILSGSFCAEFWFYVDITSQWRHMLEYGFDNHNWNCAFRIETGDNANQELYIAISDGTGFDEITINNAWNLSTWRHFALSYDYPNQIV